MQLRQRLKYFAQFQFQLLESCRRLEIRKRHGPEHSKYVRKEETLKRLCESSTKSGDSRRMISPFEVVRRTDLLFISSLLLGDDDLWDVEVFADDS